MRFLSYLVTLLTIVLLASCGGGGGSAGAVSGGGSQALFTTAPAALTLTLGSAQDFTVGGGAAPYTAVSNDTSTAVGGIAGTTLTLGAVQPGTATITVRDSRGATTAVAVTVKPKSALATSMPAVLTLAVGNGAAQAYTVTGGVPPYVVTSNNPNVLSVTLNSAGNGIVVTGLASGEATVRITDNVGASVSSVVTVTPASNVALFTTAPGDVTIATRSNITYSIGGGTAPYTVTSSNASVATVSQTDSSFTLHGVAPGVTTVVIRDALGGTVDVAVTVSNTQLSLNPNKSSSFIGDVNYAYIIGGVGPFTALSGFAGAATVSIGTLSTTTGVFTADSNGNVLKIVANQAVNPDQIIVTDSVGNSASYALTATPGTTQVSLIPGELTISACYAGDVTLLLYGSSGNVNVFSSDTSVFTAAVTNSSSNPVVVTATKTIVDPTLGGTTTITAIDAAGSSAVSTITVVPSAAACPP
jgi:hypothetical protein